MTISEKAAYFKGLVEGLGADRDSREGKLWTTLTDILSDIVSEITDLKDTTEDFADAMDEITSELEYIEDITCDLDSPEDFGKYGPCGAPEESCSGECGSCGMCDFGEEDEDEGDVVAFADYLPEESERVPDFAAFAVPPKEQEPAYDTQGFQNLRGSGESDEQEEAYDEPEYDGVVYDVTCPVCGEEISFEEETLAQGFVICPGCGEKLEFDLSDEEE